MPSRRQIAMRQRLAAHIGAGFRLRRTVTAGDLDHPSIEGIFDGSGHVEHAEGPARDAREVLCSAVRHIDRIRAGKEDSEAALQAWQGLVEGRWSLVDHLDSDGKRFVVAHRNEPGCQDPRGLTERERQIAEYFGLGRTSKEIAYTLGVRATYVDNVLGRVMDKLGLSGRAEMALFFSPLGTRRTIKLFRAGDSELAVGELAASREKLQELSDAERDVVERALHGATVDAIAAARGVSSATVAAQLQQVYRRFGVGSRAELALALLGASPVADA